MRAFVPEHPRGRWMLLAGDAESAVGSGLTLPFLPDGDDANVLPEEVAVA
jgi:hypothetical protein